MTTEETIAEVLRIVEDSTSSPADIMTAEEIIAEVRLLASDMAIRGACPGEVSPSLQYRITDFLCRAGTPFAPWRDHRKYLTKTGTAICDGKEVPCQVHKAVVDDTAGELCREIAQCLMVSKWTMLPESKDWTADRAELAIKDAVARLPGLCDRLEATSEPPKPVVPQAGTLAGGKPDGKTAKGKRGRRKGVPASDVKEDQRIADAWAKNFGEYKTQEELATAFGITKPDVVTALDRHRKRLAKSETIRAGKPRQAQ